MIEVHEVLREPLPSGEQLILPFELRQKSRLRATSVAGTEFALLLPRGTVLIPELALEARVKVGEDVAPDSVVPLRLTGIELPAREAYFKVG